MSSCWSDSVWGEDREDGQKYGPEYYSARGESCPPSLMTMDEYLNKNNNEEYAYVFTSAGWVCYDMNEFNDSDPEVTTIPEGGHNGMIEEVQQYSPEWEEFWYQSESEAREFSKDPNSHKRNTLHCWLLYQTL